VNITVISEDRLPTLPDGHNGLGKSLHDLATGLARRGHDVTLVAAEGSTFEDGTLLTPDWEHPIPMGDVMLDGSHAHHHSRFAPKAAILNRIGDLECTYQPPNTVVATQDMRRHYAQARVIPTGVDVDTIPFYPAAGDYLVFMGTPISRKGWPGVVDMAKKAGKELRTGENLTGREKWDLLGGALALLHPSTEDAAPRLPLEAAAAGVPTLCLNRTGTPEHVAHCLTGFVCETADELIDAVRDAHLLDRVLMRSWVIKTHGLTAMLDAYEAALIAVAGGERW
jgi:glycosyltransferase involved in cell wall biosynthesis